MTESIDVHHDPTSPLAIEAAGAVRRLILARREADEVKVYAIFFETMTEIVRRIVGDDVHDLRERSEYLAAVLSSFSHIVGVLSVKASVAEREAVLAQPGERSWEYLRAFVEDLEKHGVTF